MNLQTLDPGEPPDLVTPVLRRFRWRVVLFTVVAVVVAASASAWAAAAITHDSSLGLPERLMTPEQAAILDGAGICQTPSFNVGGTEVALVEAAPMPGGGSIALHFVVHGEKPLTEQRDQPDGSSFARFTTITTTAAGSAVGGIEAQPGATWGEAYMQVPLPFPVPLDMKVTGPDPKDTGDFQIDLGAVGCAP